MQEIVFFWVWRNLNANTLYSNRLWFGFLSYPFEYSITVTLLALDFLWNYLTLIAKYNNDCRWKTIQVEVDGGDVQNLAILTAFCNLHYTLKCTVAEIFMKWLHTVFKPLSINIDALETCTLYTYGIASNERWELTFMPPSHILIRSGKGL